MTCFDDDDVLGDDGQVERMLKTQTKWMIYASETSFHKGKGERSGRIVLNGVVDEWLMVLFALSRNGEALKNDQRFKDSG